MAAFVKTMEQLQNVALTDREGADAMQVHQSAFDADADAFHVVGNAPRERFARDLSLHSGKLRVAFLSGDEDGAIESINALADDMESLAPGSCPT